MEFRDFYPVGASLVEGKAEWARPLRGAGHSRWYPVNNNKKPRRNILGTTHEEVSARTRRLCSAHGEIQQGIDHQPKLCAPIATDPPLFSFSRVPCKSPLPGWIDWGLANIFPGSTARLMLLSFSYTSFP